MTKWTSFLDSPSILALLLTICHRELCLDVPGRTFQIRSAALHLCEVKASLAYIVSSR